ncbi:MAG TPA: STAS domain-containing protein [Roseiflexaceae bacterium]|nr:STAS domain-containing protein [Roseiflexaceae bacterium]
MSESLPQPFRPAPSQHQAMVAAPASTLSTIDQPALDFAAAPHQLFFDTLPMGVIAYRVVSRTELRVAFLNRAGGSSLEQQTKLVGLTLEELLPPETAAKVLHYCLLCLDHETPMEIEDSYMLETGRMWSRSKYLPVREGQGPISHILLMWEDITAQKQREQEELARQEEIIKHQAATLEALSTPLLSISASTVVLPLIGAIDTQRAQQLLTTLLAGVAERRAQVVILDITGVPIVDSQVAAVFQHVSEAVGLLGARVVITGIRPEVAQTVVGLGIDLQRIVTRNSLRDGIAYALQHERSGDARLRNNRPPSRDGNAR